MLPIVAPAPGDTWRRQQSDPKIVSVSTVFPNPEEPGHGLFVRYRLLHLAEIVPVVVVSPVPVLDYSNPRGDLFAARRVPFSRKEGIVEVLHPRFLFPPMGTPVTPVCLALSLIRTLTTLRRTFRFDLIDAHFGYPEGVAVFLASRILKSPYTITLRGNEQIWSESRSRRVLIQAALRNAVRVIAVSEHLRQFAVDLGVIPEKAITIPNGVDSSIFYPRASTAQRTSIGLSSSAKIVLSAGSLGPGKGHHSVLKALRHLSSCGMDAVAVIAGGPGRDGRYEQQLRKLVLDLQLERKIYFLGSISPDALAGWMSAADVLCLASSSEGWPNVVHEALACGCPVVANDVGAVRQMLPSEEYGFIVPVSDDTRLAAALQRALQKTWDRPEISAWGRSRNWRQVAIELSTVLSEASGLK